MGLLAPFLAPAEHKRRALAFNLAFARCALKSPLGRAPFAREWVRIGWPLLLQLLLVIPAAISPAAIRLLADPSVIPHQRLLAPIAVSDRLVGHENDDAPTLGHQGLSPTDASDVDAKVRRDSVQFGRNDDLSQAAKRADFLAEFRWGDSPTQLLFITPPPNMSDGSETAPPVSLIR